MTQLQNKICLVTGASSGIGRATAKLFAQHGATVIVSARRDNLLQTLVQEISADGGTAINKSGDMTDEKHHIELSEFIKSEFGSLDVAFNNAGALGTLADLPSLSLAQWQETIASNLTSAFLSAKHQIPLMKEGSSSIFTSSFVGPQMGMAGMSAYAAAKAGVTGMVKTLASECGEKGIRVNAILPGGTDTDMASTFAPDEDSKAFVRSLHALKRIATPQEIAKAALFLASDAASFVTGASISVDGGVSITKT